MSLYLQVEIGGLRYLLAAARLVEVGAIGDPGEAVSAEGKPIPVVDLRDLLDGDPAAPAHPVVYGQLSGDCAALLVDRVDGLVELADDAFSPLPPIGLAGRLIDAVATSFDDEMPPLRLRGERALAATGV